MATRTSATDAARQTQEQPAADVPGLGNARRIVTCPACSGQSVYAASNPYRPFCSARCKGVDLGAWASESFRVPTELPPEDEAFGDPKLQ